MTKNQNMIAPKILVVDDDFVSAAVLEDMLKNDGFAVVGAASGPEARSLAALEKPDLILMDVQMPGESGFEACRELKKTPTLSDIPVIFVTSVQDVESKIVGFDAGGVDYITKPYERAEVIARVSLHLRLARAYESLVEQYAEKITKLASAQKAIMPVPEDVPGAQFSVVYKPLEEAGGDFYDVVQVAEDVYDFVVADISGHDLGTSLATAALKAVLHQDLSLLFTPTEIVKMLNDVMRSVLSEGQFLTLVYIRLNRSNNVMTVVNAGHPPVIIVDRLGNPHKLAFSGDVLGAFRPACMASQDRRVSKGDRVFIFTDGALETHTEEHISRKMHLSWVAAACADSRDIPIADAAEKTMEAMLSDGSIVQDDVVFMAVEV